MFERTPYILNFNELRSYCSNNVDFLLKSDGICKHCFVHSNCLSDNRNEIIHAILSMEQKESRFPRTLSLVQNILEYSTIFRLGYTKRFMESTIVLSPVPLMQSLLSIIWIKLRPLTICFQMIIQEWCI